MISAQNSGLTIFSPINRAWANSPSRFANPQKPANLRSWCVVIIRSKGEYLGTVEAPDRERAEAAAIEQFDLDQDQRRRLLIRERS
jgi:hypothetical protein